MALADDDSGRHSIASDFYPPDDIRIWLYTSHPRLKGARAIDLINAGRTEEVLAVVESLYSGASTWLVTAAPRRARDLRLWMRSMRSSENHSCNRRGGWHASREIRRWAPSAVGTTAPLFTMDGVEPAHDE
jgi:hypothetical protein